LLRIVLFPFFTTLSVKNYAITTKLKTLKQTTKSIN
jgi:hypothetical protein